MIEVCNICKTINNAEDFSPILPKKPGSYYDGEFIPCEGCHAKDRALIKLIYELRNDLQSVFISMPCCPLDDDED